MSDTTTTGRCRDPHPHAPHKYIAPGVEGVGDGIDSTLRSCGGVSPCEVLTETQVLDTLSRAFNRLIRTADVSGHRQAGLRVAMRAARSMDDVADVIDELATMTMLRPLAEVDR